MHLFEVELVPLNAGSWAKANTNLPQPSPNAVTSWVDELVNPRY